MLTPALLALAPLVAAPQDSETTPPWLGCWGSDSGAEVFWFEPERCGWLQRGTPKFYRAEYAEGRARLERWARLTELELHFDDDVLVIEVGTTQHVLERVDVPEALRVPTYDIPLPEDVEVDEDTIEMLREDLADRRREDQRVRSGPNPSPSEMLPVDRDNTAFLKEIVHELGWIDAKRFGSEAADAAFLLVQHTEDLRLMQTARPFIEADVRAGRLDGQAFALLHDRLQLRLGHLQRYGSQIGTAASGDLVLMPLEDPDAVDTRRAEMGMGPLSDYLDLFRESDRRVLRFDEAIPAF